jgi:hypothetical protein
MFSRAAYLAGLALLCVLLMVAAGCQKQASSSHARPENRVPGEYIVQLATTATGEKPLRAAFGKLDLQQIRRLATDKPLYLIRVAHDPGLEAMRKHAQGVEAIVHIQPNYRYRKLSSPDPSKE